MEHNGRFRLVFFVCAIVGPLIPNTKKHCFLCSFLEAIDTRMVRCSHAWLRKIALQQDALQVSTRLIANVHHNGHWLPSLLVQSRYEKGRRNFRACTLRSALQHRSWHGSMLCPKTVMVVEMQSNIKGETVRPLLPILMSRNKIYDKTCLSPWFIPPHTPV